MARWDPEALARACEMSREPELDWTAVSARIDRERVGPLLYLVLRETQILPEYLLQSCHYAYVRTAAENVLRMKELSTLLTAFEAYGIPTIVLKGAALLEPLYQNIALRPMVDLDLLVPHASAQLAMAVMNAQGYSRHGSDLTPHSALLFENELMFCKQDRLNWQVELHWNLFDSPYYQGHISESDLWESPQYASIDGRSARIFTPTMQFLHLSGHLVLHHGARGMLWWYDLVELVHKWQSALDWDSLLREATKYDLVIATKIVTSTLADDWHVPIPRSVTMVNVIPSRDEQNVVRRLMTENRAPAQRLLDDLMTMQGFGQRVTFLMQNLFPSTAYMDTRYDIPNAAARPFYYPYRWVRGLAGRSIAKHKLQR